MAACTKSEPTKYRNLQRTVDASNTDTLVYVVMETLDSDNGAEVIEFPQHVRYAEFERETGTGKITYYYLSEENYVGEDLVKFKIISDPGPEPAEVTYIHLKINVK